MQSKGAIKFFAIAMALVCLYQLSFTFVTKHWENKAKDYAQGDPIKEKTYLDSISTVPVYNILVKNYTYRECKENEINLGLDLKGGMNVTMEVFWATDIRVRWDSKHRLQVPEPGVSSGLKIPIPSH